MIYYRIPDPKGGADRFTRVSEARGAPSSEDMGVDLVLAHEVPRMPQDGERWDAEAGAFVLEIDDELHAAIDAGAGAFRARFITAIVGQESAYRRKKDEARSLLAGDGGPWPMIEAEAAATGMETRALAAAIIASADAWNELEPKIEAARLGAKKGVSAASGTVSKRAAAAVDWEALDIGSAPQPATKGE